MDKNKHKIYMAQILKQVFQDKELCNLLAFKGGTALMFFHDLPRFSTDLDFNLLDSSREKDVYEKVRQILSKYGTIDDEAIKHYGIVMVLNYGKGERMLKVEISNRVYANHYEIRNLAGTDIRVMTISDMFAHKLCALVERITPRDVFDCWFFLQRKTSINESIIRERTGLSLAEYLPKCVETVKNVSVKILMQGLGEVLLDNKSKTFVKSRLIQDTVDTLELFSMFPIVNRE